MVILDCTMGNKMLWRGNKNPPIHHVIFTDRNFEAVTKPTVYADYRYLPFRDGTFESVIFDPPHAARNGIHRGFNFQNPAAWSYYGWDVGKRELITGMARASKEIARVGKRMCFKWSEVDYQWHQIHSLFSADWVQIHRLDLKTGAKGVLSYWIILDLKPKVEEGEAVQPESPDSWGALGGKNEVKGQQVREGRKGKNSGGRRRRVGVPAKGNARLDNLWQPADEREEESSREGEAG